MLIITNSCAAAAIKSTVILGILTNGGAATNGAHVVHTMAYQATVNCHYSAVSLTHCKCTYPKGYWLKPTLPTGVAIT